MWVPVGSLMDSDAEPRPASAAQVLIAAGGPRGGGDSGATEGQIRTVVISGFGADSVKVEGCRSWLAGGKSAAVSDQGALCDAGLVRGGGVPEVCGDRKGCSRPGCASVLGKSRILRWDTIVQVEVPTLSSSWVVPRVGGARGALDRLPLAGRGTSRVGGAPGVRVVRKVSSGPGCASVFGESRLRWGTIVQDEVPVSCAVSADPTGRRAREIEHDARQASSGLTCWYAQVSHAQRPARSVAAIVPVCAGRAWLTCGLL